MADFKQILNRSMSSIEKPKPVPVGTYQARIGQYTLGETKGEKQTPFVEFPVNLISAGPDVDTDHLEEFGGIAKLTKTKSRVTFYLTDDALWRLVGFLEGALQISGVELAEALPMTLNQTITVHINHRLNPKNKEVYAEVDQTAPAE